MLHDDLDGDVWTVFLKEVAQHLALQQFVCVLGESKENLPQLNRASLLCLQRCR